MRLKYMSFFCLQSKNTLCKLRENSHFLQMCLRGSFIKDVEIFQSPSIPYASFPYTLYVEVTFLDPCEVRRYSGLIATFVTLTQNRHMFSW